MKRVCVLAAALATAAILSGCANKPKSLSGEAPKVPGVDRSIKTAAIARPAAPNLKSKPKAEPKDDPDQGFQLRSSGLRGRTMTVSNINEIRLHSKEVVLTFDDGPVPTHTNRVLTALDKYNVKATFLMTGSMARANPSLALKVFQKGHSVGSHSYTHSNLARMSTTAAINDINRGERAVEAALGGNRNAVGFFRFPYLADTKTLRSTLAGRGIVVLDVDVDSKDYFKSSPDALVLRTMSRLRKRGKGIILLHDLQARTAKALPALLAALNREGFKVVHLKYRGDRRGPVLVSSLDEKQPDQL